MGEEWGGLNVSVYDTLKTSVTNKSTPPKRQYSTTIVIISTSIGLIEILPGHQPFITTVTIDNLIFSGPGRRYIFIMGDGFVGIDPGDLDRVCLIGYGITEEWPGL